MLIMPVWQARAALTTNSVTTQATDEAAAQAEIVTQIEAALSGWTAGQVAVRASFAVSEWVIAKRAAAAPEEYARILQGATELRVAFADGTQRGLAAVVRRV